MSSVSINNLLCFSSTVTVSSRTGSYGHTWMRNAIKSRVANDVRKRSPQQELDDYLAAPLEDVADVVVWWGVSLSHTRIHFLN